MISNIPLPGKKEQLMVLSATAIVTNLELNVITTTSYFLF